MTNAASIAQRAMRLLRPLRIDWGIVLALISLSISAVGLWYYHNPAAVIHLSANLILATFVYLDWQAAHRDNYQARTVIAWLSMSGVVVVVYFLPIFFISGILALVDGMLRSLSPEQSSRRTIFISSLLLIGALLLLIVCTEAVTLGLRSNAIVPFVRFEADLRTFLGRHFPSLPITPATPYLSIAFTQFAFICYFTLAIVTRLRRYYQRYISTITQITRVNDDLTNAQQQLQQNVLERTKLLEISRMVTQPQEMESLLRTMVDSLYELIDFGRVSICLMNDGVPNTLYSAGALPDSDELRIRLLEHPLYKQTLSAMHQPMLIRRLVELLPTIDGTFLAVPLVVRGEYIGFLAVRHAEPDHYDARVIDVCMALANQIAGAIDAVHLQAAATQALIAAERSRLARELHDSVSQSLYGIVLGTRTALQQISSAEDAAHAANDAQIALEYSTNLAGTALAQVRALIFTLRPENLEKIGLVAALKAQIELLRTHTTTNIRFDAPDQELDISLLRKETLYRIAVEAIQNAVRHAQCRTVVMRLSSTAGDVDLEIIDDGVGFDASIEDTRHGGIRIMRERAASILAVLVIDSKRGVGTRVGVRIPLGLSAHIAQ